MNFNETPLGFVFFCKKNNEKNSNAACFKSRRGEHAGFIMNGGYHDCVTFQFKKVATPKMTGFIHAGSLYILGVPEQLSLISLNHGSTPSNPDDNLKSLTWVSGLFRGKFPAYATHSSLSLFIAEHCC
jgi:hypothetical protein